MYLSFEPKKIPSVNQLTHNQQNTTFPNIWSTLYILKRIRFVTSSQFKIWISFSIILTLLHQTPKIKRNVKFYAPTILKVSVKVRTAQLRLIENFPPFWSYKVNFSTLKAC